MSEESEAIARDDAWVTEDDFVPGRDDEHHDERVICPVYALDCPHATDCFAHEGCDCYGTVACPGWCREHGL